MKIHKNLLLLVLALAQFMVVLDASITNVALPSIAAALHFSPQNLQWIVTAYTLAFGGFLLFGGRMADLYGRRRTFMAGLIAFTVGSMVVGASQNEAMMIIARAFQGLAAAFMSPAALSIVLTEFKEGKERTKALGVWSAVAAGGAAAGLLFGGILTEFLDWRWNFFVNVPVGIILIILAMRYVPAHPSEADHNDLDLPGAILVTGGLMALVYSLSQAPSWGWGSAKALLWIGGAVVILVLFILNELRSKHPLMPLSIFKIRNLSGANLTQLPITAAMFSMFFFVSLYLQNILQFSPLRTGLSFLPFTIVLALTATNVGRFITKIGYKPFMVAGPLVIATALFILSHIKVGGSYLTGVLPGVALLSFGAGLSFIAVSIAATSGVPRQLNGLASGLLNTAQQIGGALGLAVLSGVAASTASQKVAAAAAASQTNPLSIEQTKAVFAQATVSGFHNALLVGVGFAIAAALIALLVIKQLPVRRDDIVVEPVA